MILKKGSTRGFGIKEELKNETDDLRRHFESKDSLEDKNGCGFLLQIQRYFDFLLGMVMIYYWSVFG